MAERAVCILGGGIGGVVAANLLKKKLGPAAKVTLIDKSSYHVFQPSFLSVLSGKRSPDQIKRPLNRLEKKGIEFIGAEVTEIVPDQNSIKVDGRELKYDYLVIALGAASNMAAIGGLDQAAINLYSLEGILDLKQAIGSFDSGEVVILIPSMPYKCPAAPYEAAFLFDAEFKRRKIRKRVNLHIFTFEPQPMPAAGPDIGRAIEAILEKRNINFNPQISVSSINTDTKEISLIDGRKVKADLLIAIPPHKAPDVVKAAGLTNEAGWIPVNPKTLQTHRENIFAVGDVSAVKLEGRYNPEKPLMLPKAGVFAHREAEVVAENIAAKILGKGNGKEFDGKGSCFLELGDGTAGFASGNFYERPHPQVQMRNPSRLWHLYKIAFEKYWFWRWF